MKTVLTFTVLGTSIGLATWISPFWSTPSFTNGSNRCSADEQCGLLSKCNNLCTKVQQGLLQADKKFQSLLSEKLCGFSSGKIKVCCEEENLFQAEQCPELGDGGEGNWTCGKRFTRTSFITGGEDTSPGEWPWMARLLYDSPEEKSGAVTNCAGTLITSRHVVTAAHCIEDTIKPVAVALGDSDVTTDYDCFDVNTGCATSGEECFAKEECAPKHVEVNIRTIVKHEKFKICTRCIPSYDIALLVLEDPVQFSDFIQPVCLPGLGRASAGPLTVTGWGNTVAGILRIKTSSILQELNLKEIPFTECLKTWKQGLDIDLIPTHMCASTEVQGKASCKGDSGGPLVRQVDFLKQISELAGVVSFGVSICGNADFPLGFTRIEGEINSWLQEQVGQELPKQVQ